jgi:hypothetical protein
MCPGEWSKAHWRKGWPGRCRCRESEARGPGRTLIPVKGLWGRGVAGWGYYGLNSPSGADRDSSFWRGLLIVAAAGVLAVFMPKAAACLAAAGLRRARDEPLARLASGDDDPFHPGVQALASALRGDAVVEFAKGCHDGSFFAEQEPPSLSFLAAHITSG